MCPECHDTQWKSVVVDGVERVVRCDCWRHALVDRALSDAGIPAGYKHCTLANFVIPRAEHPAVEALADALRATATFAERFPAVDHGLFFLGPPGVGKTHLAVAALNEVIHTRGARGYFYKTAELLQQIRNTYNRSVEETEMEVLTPIFEADLLVLDDVGVERPTDWVQEMLAVVIDKRYSSRKATILTANLNDDAPDSRQFFDSVQYRLGARTRSRLKEMCRWITIDSYDTREIGIRPTDKDIREWARRSRQAAQMPDKTQGMAKARLRGAVADAELKWSGGKAGS